MNKTQMSKQTREGKEKARNIQYLYLYKVLTLKCKFCQFFCSLFLGIYRAQTIMKQTSEIRGYRFSEDFIVQLLSTHGQCNIFTECRELHGQVGWLNFEFLKRISRQSAVLLQYRNWKFIGTLITICAWYGQTKPLKGTPPTCTGKT